MMKQNWIFCIVPVLAACFAATAQAGFMYPELRAQLAELRPDDEISVIVTLTDQLDLKQFKEKEKKVRREKINRSLREKADTTQRSLKKFLQHKNVRKIRPYWIFNGMAVTLRADQVEELAARPEVQSVRLDGVLTLPLPSLSLAGSPEWNLNAIHAPALWELGYTGTGVVIAGMDTGVDYLHPDLETRWRGGDNSWFDPRGQTIVPYDSDGHGTGTMGIMVGGDAGGTSIGVAPGARWIAVKVFADDGKASYSDIHSGFQWLLDPDGNPDTDDLPDVVNNSWGLDAPGECFDVFQQDIQALRAFDVAVVFAAGNTGPAGSTSISPANYPESFAAGAVDSNLSVANFSARGSSTCDGAIFPEIVSPGVNIRTADLTGGGIFPNSYRTASGTSFAAPHVAGAMALLLQADPELTVNELEALLVQSAVDLGVAGEDNAYGYGLLDLAAAYALLVHPPPFTITASAGDNGTIDPAGVVPIESFGADQEFIMVPDPGYHVADILVDGVSAGAAEAYIFSEVTTDHTIHVTFSNTYSLAVEITGKGIGSVSGNPPEIQCPDACNAEYPVGEVVTLTVVPGQGSTFAGWSGDCTGGEMSCEVVMDGERTVTAGFYSFPWELFIPISIGKNPQ